MNRNKLKIYAPQARREFIEAVRGRAAHYGLADNKIESITVQGDVVLIAGRPFPGKIGDKRKKLENRIERIGFEQLIEAMAYTWFNRLVAIRFMEIHEYFEHGFRVLSHPESHGQPEILDHAQHAELPGLDQQKVIELKLEGTNQANENLYRMLLIAQCNALSKAMPFLFESIDDETELLLPDNLLHSDSLIRKLVGEIPEEDWQEVEIIGWLYQFYISEKKDEVIGKVVKSEDIPAATQLFTPNWIVKYLVQNSLGRQWMATYPNSSLKDKMEYYIEPAEQTEEVQAKLAEITPTSLNPEELTLLDPACGSGHILVEAYELLKAIYQERGYRAKDIPRLILEKNLFGLEIDDRAAQLAAFALMMMARADDRNIFDRDVQPNVRSIQESKGLDSKAIFESLKLSEDRVNSEQSLSEIDVARMLELYEQARTFGSLIKIPSDLGKKLPLIVDCLDDTEENGGMFDQRNAAELRPFIEQTRLLISEYDIVCANPPYMGGRKYMNPDLKSFAADNYPSSKADLFSMFIERGPSYCRTNGRVAMVTMEAWMFLSTFAGFRDNLLSSTTLQSLCHMPYEGKGRTAMGIAFGTAAFIVAKPKITNAKAHFCFVQNHDLNESLVPRVFPPRNTRLGYKVTDNFGRIPGKPVAYWASEGVFRAFESGIELDSIAPVRQGLATTDNNRFLRRWHELPIGDIHFRAKDCKDAKKSQSKWFPYNKGGDYRRWFGNNEFVVNWWNDGSEIKENIISKYPYLNGKPGFVAKNPEFYFRPSVTWTFISSAHFGVRQSDEGFIFDVAGSSAFPAKSLRNAVTGLLCSKLAEEFMKALNPTLNFQVGNVASLPFPAEYVENNIDKIDDVVEQCVEIARTDWDSHETSWGFSRLSWLDRKFCKVSEALADWDKTCLLRSEQLEFLEAENNKHFIEAYRLEDEISPNVDLDQITLYRPSRLEDIKRLNSYAIGCMMGRYSLDEPGLIYAQSGNEGFDPAQYKTFPADEDGIVPLTELEWFEDDAALRFVNFIATAWAKEHLEENLKFVAESLGQKRGESPRESVRRYLASDFYKHHLSMYKKRPIYWLFSSGKLRGFQALVYLHRYNEGTLARLRTQYVIPLIGKMNARLGHLTDDIAKSTSSKLGKKSEKEKALITKQLAEVQTFEEKLRHYADQRIALDLDDGVKVNYGKFGDLLAEVKAVTGKKTRA